MTKIHIPEFDPDRDLLLERIVDVRKELVWMAWTNPEHLKKWFTPRPWKTIACEIDLRPGGRFHTVMQSPEGQEFPGSSCYLEVIENHKLVWTTALLPGYRPVPTPKSEHDLLFTAIILLESVGDGTKYSAYAIHQDEASKNRHEAMGFTEGWGAALDQLVESVNGL